MAESGLAAGLQALGQGLAPQNFIGALNQMEQFNQRRMKQQAFDDGVKDLDFRASRDPKLKKRVDEMRKFQPYAFSDPDSFQQFMGSLQEYESAESILEGLESTGSISEAMVKTFKGQMARSPNEAMDGMVNYAAGVESMRARVAAEQDIKRQQAQMTADAQSFASNILAQNPEAVSMEELRDDFELLAEQSPDVLSNPQLQNAIGDALSAALGKRLAAPPTQEVLQQASIAAPGVAQRVQSFESKQQQAAELNRILAGVSDPKLRKALASTASQLLQAGEVDTGSQVKETAKDLLLELTTNHPDLKGEEVFDKIQSADLSQYGPDAEEIRSELHSQAEDRLGLSVKGLGVEKSRADSAAKVLTAQQKLIETQQEQKDKFREDTQKAETNLNFLMSLFDSKDITDDDLQNPDLLSGKLAAMQDVLGISADRAEELVVFSRENAGKIDRALAKSFETRGLSRELIADKGWGVGSDGVVEVRHGAPGVGLGITGEDPVVKPKVAPSNTATNEGIISDSFMSRREKGDKGLLGVAQVSRRGLVELEDGTYQTVSTPVGDFGRKVSLDAEGRVEVGSPVKLSIAGQSRVKTSAINEAHVDPSGPQLMQMFVDKFHVDAGLRPKKEIAKSISDFTKLVQANVQQNEMFPRILTELNALKLKAASIDDKDQNQMIIEIAPLWDKFYDQQAIYTAFDTSSVHRL